MKYVTEINSCEQCHYVNHSGAFTPGGAQPVCGHPDKTKGKGASWTTRVIPHTMERGFQNLAKVTEIPRWCPLRKDEVTEDAKDKYIAVKRMKDYALGWDSIEVGQVWCNKKSNRLVVVLLAPEYRYHSVKLLHNSDQETFKQTHYFLYDYEQVGETNEYELSIKQIEVMKIKYKRVTDEKV